MYLFSNYEIQAAVLRTKLSRLDYDNKKRHDIAIIYLKNINHPDIILPKLNSTEDFEHSHVWHIFVIRCANREKLQQYLTSNGIQTLIHYPIPPHQQSAYKEWKVLNFLITEQIHNEVLSLPMSPMMSIEEVKQIVSAVNKYR